MPEVISLTGESSKRTKLIYKFSLAGLFQNFKVSI